jgi:hypothetical protein
MLEDYLKKCDVPAENILIINKESLVFDFIRNYMDLYRYVKEYFQDKNGSKYLFVDEIQEIGKWQKAVTSFLAENTADLCITGSNAHLLSSELATLLSGRYIEVHVYPLTFREFLTFREANNKKEIKEKQFELYLKYGGLPAIHLLELTDSMAYEYLNSVFNTILLKDVVARHNIRDINLLERITRYTFDNCGNITTSKRITEYFKSQQQKVTVDTVQNYLSYLKAAYLIYEVKRYDIKGKRHLEFYEKYYMGDIGLRHGFLGYRKEDISGLLENIIYLELLTRGYKVFTGKQEQLEVDFIAEREGERLYIQVCYLLASPETAQREFAPLEKIEDNYPKWVLSMDTVWGRDKAGIIRKNIVDFLTEGYA